MKALRDYLLATLAVAPAVAFLLLSVTWYVPRLHWYCDEAGGADLLAPLRVLVGLLSILNQFWVFFLLALFIGLFMFERFGGPNKNRIRIVFLILSGLVVNVFAVLFAFNMIWTYDKLGNIVRIECIYYQKVLKQEGLQDKIDALHEGKEDHNNTVDSYR